MADASVKINTEKIQRAALIVLFDGLNTLIASSGLTWTTDDAAYFAELGRSAPGWTVETIPTSNFYSGHIPSLIQAPLEKYPNICTICYIATPKQSDDDTGEFYSLNLAVEIMVKSDESEEEVNSRIQKTLEAAHLTLMDNPTLNKTVVALTAPTQTIGDVFVRRAENSRGDRWFWQGGALEYVVDKYVDFDQ